MSSAGEKCLNLTHRLRVTAAISGKSGRSLREEFVDAASDAWKLTSLSSSEAGKKRGRQVYQWEETFSIFVKCVGRCSLCEWKKYLKMIKVRERRDREKGRQRQRQSGKQRHRRHKVLWLSLLLLIVTNIIIFVVIIFEKEFKSTR